jgi:predicted ATP-grasp superfamily ATP-dependent carboligase
MAAQPYRILVTDGEQRAALAVVRSLGAEGHIVHVAACARHTIAGASRYTRRTWRVPDALEQPTQFADAVRTIVQQAEIEIVIPISEASLLAILPIRDRLAARLPFPDIDTFRAICHKGLVLDTAQSVGIAIPAQHTVTSVSALDTVPYDTLPYPLVVKPARSVADGPSTSAPRDHPSGDAETRTKFIVRHAADREALRSILETMEPQAFPLLLQQRVIGPGVGIFVLLWNDTILAAFSHQRIREKPPSGGVSVYRVSRSMDHTLLDRSIALLRAFGWCGVAMVEYKVDERTGVPFLMEINGRFWGSLQLAIDAGVDFPTLLVRAATGEQPTPVVAYDTACGSRWWWGDVDHLIARLRHSNQALALPPDAPTRWAAVRSVLTRRAGDRPETFRLHDPSPFFVESIAWITDLVRRS